MFCCFERDFSAGRTEEAWALKKCWLLLARHVGKGQWYALGRSAGCQFWSVAGNRAEAVFPLSQLTYEGLPYFHPFFYQFAGSWRPKAEQGRCGLTRVHRQDAERQALLRCCCSPLGCGPASCDHGTLQRQHSDTFPFVSELRKLSGNIKWGAVPWHPLGKVQMGDPEHELWKLPLCYLQASALTPASWPNSSSANYILPMWKFPCVFTQPFFPTCSRQLRSVARRSKALAMSQPGPGCLSAGLKWVLCKASAGTLGPWQDSCRSTVAGHGTDRAKALWGAARLGHRESSRGCPAPNWFCSLFPSLSLDDSCGRCFWLIPVGTALLSCPLIALVKTWLMPPERNWLGLSLSSEEGPENGCSNSCGILIVKNCDSQRGEKWTHRYLYRRVAHWFICPMFLSVKISLWL